VFEEWSAAGWEGGENKTVVNSYSWQPLQRYFGFPEALAVIFNAFDDHKVIDPWDEVDPSKRIEKGSPFFQRMHALGTFFLNERWHRFKW
jgi:hypothetical protein